MAAAHVKLIESGVRIFVAAFTIVKVTKLGVNACRSNPSNATNSNTQPKAENLVNEAAFGIHVLGRAFSKAAHLEIALREIAALLNPFTSKISDKQAESKVENLVNDAVFGIGVLGRAFSKAARLEVALCEIATLFNLFNSKKPDKQPESEAWRPLEKVLLVARLYVLGSSIFSSVKTGFGSRVKSA
ncbi:unnamed protein product [Trichobilharzia szidati]|nr:unnamed protein product [Trichobilharzia szidati]